MTRKVLLCLLGLSCAATFAAPSREAQDHLNKLNQDIKDNNYHFSVKYSDLMEQPIDRITGYKKSPHELDHAVFYSPKKLRLPSSFDWRVQAGGLTPVKNQGSCGSCWAFGTVAVFENALKIRDGVTKPLSEQQLVDCDDQSNGCGGGSFAHHVHLSPGAATSEEYPYEAANGSCKAKSDYPDKISDWGYVGGNNRRPSVDEIKNAIYQYGPVAVTVAAGMAMQGYSGGVFDSCGAWMTNHIVSLVGWNDADGGYWIMRNSWGPKWGEKGYMRIRYNCAKIGEEATFVTYKPACNPQPIAFAGADKTIQAGQSVRLGSMPVLGQTYQWSPAAGLDNPSLAMPVASPSTDTVYTVKTTTSCGSATQQVRVNVSVKN